MQLQDAMVCFDITSYISVCNYRHFNMLHANYITTLHNITTRQLGAIITFIVTCSVLGTLLGQNINISVTSLQK